MKNFWRILKPAFILGGIAFAVGYFGPIYWAPEANQGPLLGIFVTGPLGFVFGLGWGVFRETQRAAREKRGDPKR